MTTALDDKVEALLSRLAVLEGRLERMHRYGPATDVDVSNATKPRARIQVGVDDEGNPVKGPWQPFATVAGARNMHNPPSAGQQFLMIAPDGEHEAGILVPLGHSSKVPSPSTDPATYVDQTGATDIRFKDGKHQVKTGEKTAHLLTTDGQRLKVADISKLVIKIGDTPYQLKMDALEPGSDIAEF